MLTPFEKNIEVWRQLWRVLEKSHVVVQIVDARNIQLFRCADLERYLKEIDKNKQYVLLINKADLLTLNQRKVWAAYLHSQGIEFIFFSANVEKIKQEIALLRVEELKKNPEQSFNDDYMINKPWKDPNEETEGEEESEEETKESEGEEEIEEGESDEDIEDEEESEEAEKPNNESAGAKNNLSIAPTIEKSFESLQITSEEKTKEISAEISKKAAVPLPVTHVYSSVEFIDYLHKFTYLLPHLEDEEDEEESEEEEKESIKKGKQETSSKNRNKSQHETESVFPSRLVVGLVGYPNVGKSSTINVLVGAKKVAVSSTPGKTKHFQTIFVPEVPWLVLCDCPGLVFPTFVATKAEMVCNGLLSIDHVAEWLGPCEIVCSRIGREILEEVYGVELRKISVEGEKTIENYVNAHEFLSAHAQARGFMTVHGSPNEAMASRILLKDYVNGELVYVYPPPGVHPITFNEESKKRQKLELKKRRKEKLEKNGIYLKDGEEVVLGGKRNRNVAKNKSVLLQPGEKANIVASMSVGDPFFTKQSQVSAQVKGKKNIAKPYFAIPQYPHHPQEMKKMQREAQLKAIAQEKEKLLKLNEMILKKKLLDEKKRREAAANTHS